MMNEEQEKEFFSRMDKKIEKMDSDYFEKVNAFEDQIAKKTEELEDLCKRLNEIRF